jgi:hypothetical protein
MNLKSRTEVLFLKEDEVEDEGKPKGANFIALEDWG